MASTKLSRHELKENQLTTGLQNFTDAALSRGKEILIVVVLLLAVVAGLIVWSTYSGRRNDEAQDQLARMITAYNNQATPAAERYKTVIEAGDKALERAGTLPVASLIRYYLALGHEGAGETPKALALLETMAQGGDADKKGMAQFAMAGIQSRHGETEKAAALLKEMLEKGSYPKSAVALELGKVYEAAGQNETAHGYYDKVITDYGSSPLRDEAEASLRRLGFPIPVPAPVSTPTPTSTKRD